MRLISCDESYVYYLAITIIGAIINGDQNELFDIFYNTKFYKINLKYEHLKKKLWRYIEVSD